MRKATTAAAINTNKTVRTRWLTDLVRITVPYCLVLTCSTACHRNRRRVGLGVVLKATLGEACKAPPDSSGAFASFFCSRCILITKVNVVEQFVEKLQVQLVAKINIFCKCDLISVIGQLVSVFFHERNRRQYEVVPP